MKSEKQKTAMQAKQADLNAYRKLRQKTDMQRLLNGKMSTEYRVGVKVVGKIELPPAFMAQPPKSKNAKQPTQKKQPKSKNAKLHRLFREANGKCYYCGRACLLVYDELGGNVATVEHLYPREDLRRFMISNYDNTVLACNRCNTNTNEDWRELSIKPFTDLWEPWIIGIALNLTKTATAGSSEFIS